LTPKLSQASDQVFEGAQTFKTFYQNAGLGKEEENPGLFERSNKEEDGLNNSNELHRYHIARWSGFLESLLDKIHFEFHKGTPT